VQPSARKGATQCTRIVLNRSNSKGNSKPTPVLSFSNQTAIEQAEPKPQADPQAKKLCRQIQSYLLEQYDVTLTGKGRNELLTSISETQPHPVEIWYFAVAELLYALDQTDSDGFARSQASSRVPATLATAFEPTTQGSVVDRYDEEKSEPFRMAIMEVKMRKEGDARIVESHRRWAEQEAEGEEADRLFKLEIAAAQGI